jgi:hypothetical protein
MKTKVYISGAISNKDPNKKKENIKKFFDKEKELKEMWDEVINPASFERPDDDKYEEYLADDLVLIFKELPDVYMLKGWETSPGAKLEKQVARRLGLNIYYEVLPKELKK